MTDKTQSSLRYYKTDIPPCIGDHVRYEDHAEDLIVEEVIDTDDKMRARGVTEAGVMLRGERGGAIFDTMAAPDLEFVSRRK
ncbi:MAG: hypothetical protein WCS01_10490 [bacterium]